MAVVGRRSLPSPWHPQSFPQVLDTVNEPEVIIIAVVGRRMLGVWAKQMVVPSRREGAGATKTNAPNSLFPRAHGTCGQWDGIACRSAGYVCMTMHVENRVAEGQRVQQYHGKWPFR